MTEHDPIDLAEGKRRRDAELDRIDKQLDDAYRTRFHAAGASLIRAGRRRITSEDIIAIVGFPPRGDHRGIGATMRSFAHHAGLRKVGSVPSARPGRHAGPVTVWERL